jgi:hypothetical protein
VLQQLLAVRPVEGRPGAYIEIFGRPNEPIDAEKFDKSGLTLLKVEQARIAGEAGDLVFFAPRLALDTVARKVEAFRDESTRRGRPKNADLVQSIGSLQRASLRSLWRGPMAAFPAQRHAVVDWEIWLKTDAVDTFVATARAAEVPVSEDRLTFPEQTVLQVTASQEALLPIVLQSEGVMALAKPSTTAEFFDALPVEEQDQWIADLLRRTSFARVDRRTRWITLLDTGVSLGHPLIAPALNAADRLAANPAWGVEDVHGHGSGMAGLALHGDLTAALEDAGLRTVRHRLESVKIIPDAGANPHHLLGVVTRQAVDAAEVRAERTRVFTLASTTADDHPHDGAPTSWSTEIDQLAAGTSGRERKRRLILTSAGNVPSHKHLTRRYHAVCDAPDEELEAPGQAWNAITVGAYTDKVLLGDGVVGRPLAPRGDLSPHSKTASWTSTWPIKPEVVLEGGNLLLDDRPPALTCGDLSLLTTHHNAAARDFSTFEATSAATALTARMTARLWSVHPDLWPETVRALLVSSARWTPAMLSHLPDNPSKGDYDRLFCRYGYGVPNLRRAGRSAVDMVTLIIEDEITPHIHSDTMGAESVHNEIKLHRLPWPENALRRLRNRPVTLRVALSTFVEPNPAEAARGRKLRYGSHGLRFKLKRADETAPQFRARINRAAASEDERARATGAIDEDGWKFGTRRRDVGSLHIDELTCPASDLARRDLLAVHPVGGWWKTKLRPDQDLPRARYALVIEIDAEDEGADLYTEVEVAIAALVAAQAEV